MDVFKVHAPATEETETGPGRTLRRRGHLSGVLKDEQEFARSTE